MAPSISAQRRLNYLRESTAQLKKPTEHLATKQLTATLETEVWGFEHFAEPDPVEAWCPISPSRRQQIFLDQYGRRDVFTGGAAGGGKSVSLLMAASQYFSWPMYKALIFRRTYADLAQEDAIMDVAKQWWLNKNGIYWNEMHKRFTFPSGAVLRFGYLQTENDRFRYQGTQYHFIAFDELTQFSESQFTYLFSRQRKLKHLSLPIRMRATSNPGGLGHDWVKARYITREAENDLLAGHYRETYECEDDRLFIPSRLEDNPGIDVEDYRKSLARIKSPVERAQLEQGDWTISAVGIFPATKLRHYRYGKDNVYIGMDHDGSTAAAVGPGECFRIVAIDAAGTPQERERENRGKPSSYSAIVVADVHLARKLVFVRHVERLRVEAPELINAVRRVFYEYRPAIVGCENAGLGLPIYQLLCTVLPYGALVPLEPRGDKLSRTVLLQQWWDGGRVFLPNPGDAQTDWYSGFRGEFLHWTGLKTETCDQIDATAWAVIMADQYAARYQVTPILAPYMIGSPV